MPLRATRDMVRMRIHVYTFIRIHVNERASEKRRAENGTTKLSCKVSMVMGGDFYQK